jgi:hypothetical protein
MSDVTGSCLCGALKLTIPASAKLIKSMACYCIDCQKNGGGPMQTNAMFAVSEVIVSDPEGQLRMYEIGGTSSGLPKEKAFCRRCGCCMFTKPGHYNGEIIVVKTGILDAE